jgi:hypothetical protein
VTDPPGATGAADPPGVTGAGDPPITSGATDRRTVPIHQGNLVPPQDQGSAPRFLHIAGGSAGHSNQAGTGAGGQGTNVLIQAGTDFVRNFNLTHGDRLDLTKILAGAPLAHDLANLGNFVKVLGYGRNDPGFGSGTKTTLEVTGPHGTAIVNLEGVGKLDLSDLLKHQSLMLPPH